jgi:hypothetical protein
MKTKLIALYTAIATLIAATDFDEAAADAIELQATEVNLPDHNKENLRVAHAEYHENSSDLDLMEELAGDCFRDLAPYMADASAREVFQSFRDMSGTSGGEDLFSHVSNVIKHGEGEDGPATVTLTVSYWSALESLLKETRDSHIEVGHLSVVEQP